MIGGQPSLRFIWLVPPGYKIAAADPTLPSVFKGGRMGEGPCQQKCSLLSGEQKL